MRIVVVILALSIICLGCFGTDATELIIENVSDENIHDIRVNVTGNQYTIEKLIAGEKTKLNINVTDESAVYLVNANGDSLYLDVYLEPNYGGKIEAGITSDSVLYMRYNGPFN